MSIIVLSENLRKWLKVQRGNQKPQIEKYTHERKGKEYNDKQ